MKWFNREETRREELEDELRSHLAMSARELATRGESESEFAAKREFGNLTKISEDVQDTWRRFRFEQFRQDLRYAIRGLLRSLGFTITVAVTFALGAGANGAVFAAIDPLLLRTPAGVREAGPKHRVVHLGGGGPTDLQRRRDISIRDAVARRAGRAHPCLACLARGSCCGAWIWLS